MMDSRFGITCIIGIIVALIITIIIRLFRRSKTTDNFKVNTEPLRLSDRPSISSNQICSSDTQPESVFCSKLPQEMQALVLAHALEMNGVEQLPNNIGKFASTCRWWNELVHNSDILWYELAKILAPQFSGVVCGANTRSFSWKTYTQQCQHLSSGTLSCKKLFLDQPRQAGMTDSTQPMRMAFPEQQSQSWFTRTVGSIFGRQNVASTTRDTVIAPDTKIVHCVSMVGSVKSVKKLLYPLLVFDIDHSPFLRAGSYPGGGIAFHMGESETVFMSHRLGPTAQSTQGVIIVSDATGDQEELAEIASYLQICRDHNKALPVAILILKKNGCIPPSELSTMLVPILDEIDNVCIKQFDPISLDGVAQAMEWLSHHFLEVKN